MRVPLVHRYVCPLGMYVCYVRAGLRAGGPRLSSLACADVGTVRRTYIWARYYVSCLTVRTISICDRF